MNRTPEEMRLRKELAAVRSRLAGKTFDQAPEAFKDVEGIKVRIRRLQGKYAWLTRRA